MKIIKEIKDILKSIRHIKENASIFGNCAKTRDDEELMEGVTFLDKKFTKLPCNIIVDTGETYKYYNHPLCLYVVDGDNVIPVTIESQPRIKEGYKVPPEVLPFIMDNITALTDVANFKISGSQFFDSIRMYLKGKENKNA